MKVRLKENINIKDIAKNYWNGCRTDTLNFLRNYEAKEKQKIFDAEKKYGYYLIDGYLVNENAIEEVKESEEKGNMKFKVDDLQFGDIVTERNGERYVFADGCLYGEDDSYYNDCDAVDDYFDDDLNYENGYSEQDIVKVERNGITIFERGETKEMTISEISKALGYEVKVVKE